MSKTWQLWGERTHWHFQKNQDQERTASDINRSERQRKEKREKQTNRTKQSVLESRQQVLYITKKMPLKMFETQK